MPYTGPYASGEEVTFSHAWSEPGDYIIIVKVRDMFGATSPRNYIQLSISKSKAITNPVIFQLLENFIDQFPLLARLFLVNM